MKTYKISGISTTIVIFLVLGFLFLSADLAYSEIPYQEGWPQEVGEGISGITAGDLDADGDLEIIGYGSNIYVWDKDGSLLSGWPKEMPRISGSPAIGDLDGDGDLEIVVAAFDELMVYAFHHDGTLVDGWPQTARGNRYIYGASPTLGDVDGDGDLEILIPTDFGFIHVWHHDGTLLPGWGEIQEYPFVYSSLTLADVDKDGDLEIFSTSLWGPEGRVWGLHHDDKDGNGRIDRVHGWPTDMLGAKPGEVIVGDIDNDRDFEILVSAGNKVYAWHAEDGDGDGKADRVDGWPQDTGIRMRKPVLADLDGDKDLEIISASIEGTVYIWHHDGSSLNGWPKENIGYQLIIGDVDSDNQVEIIAVDATSRTEIYAYNLDGSLVDGWPLQVQGRFSSYRPTPILLADIDSDNDLEVIASSDKVYIWDIPDEYDAAFIEWGSYQHDRYNSGLYGHRIALEVPNTKGYKGIQPAVDAAQAGDFVEVDPRYTLPTSSVDLKSGIDITWSTTGAEVVALPETPWQTNAYGPQYTDIPWNYNMGYQFTPQVDGRITRLGGFFNGTKTVRLYDSSGSLLASADVTANNSWAYTDISPVEVEAGQNYTVAVNLMGSGGSARNLMTTKPLPETFGSIRILQSVYRYNSDLMPSYGLTFFMLGQADIEFVPTGQ